MTRQVRGGAAARRGAARGALGGSGACGSDPERRGRGCPRRTDEVRLAWEELTRVPRLRFSFELEASTPPSLASLAARRGGPWEDQGRADLIRSDADGDARVERMRFASRGRSSRGYPGSAFRLSSSPQPSRPTVAHPPRRGGYGEIVTHAIDGPPRDRRRGRWRVLGIAAGAIWR